MFAVMVYLDPANGNTEYLEPASGNMVVTKTTKVYSQANGSSKVKGKIKKGTQVKVRGKNSESGWYLVKWKRKNVFVDGTLLVNASSQAAKTVLAEVKAAQKKKAEAIAEAVRIAEESLNKQATEKISAQNIATSPQKVSSNQETQKKPTFDETSTVQELGDKTGSKAQTDDLHVEEIKDLSEPALVDVEDSTELGVSEMSDATAPVPVQPKVTEQSSPSVLSSSGETIERQVAEPPAEIELTEEVIEVKVENDTAALSFPPGEFEFSSAMTYFKLLWCSYFDTGFCVDLYYEKANEDRTVEAFDIFLARFPNSTYAPNVTSLRDDSFFEQAVLLDTEAAFTRYLKEYPEGKHQKEAQKEKAELKKIDELRAQLLKSPDDNALSQTIDELMWARIDENVLTDLEQLLKKTISDHLREKAEQQINRILSSYERLLENPVVEIARAGNHHCSDIRFYLPEKTSAMIWMTGEKAEKRGIEHATNGRDWLDYGGLIRTDNNEEIFPLDRGIPAGGELTNATQVDFTALERGSYKLHYKTDGRRSWGQFGNSPPTNSRWGISVYFFEFAPIAEAKLSAAFDKGVAPPREERYLVLLKLAKDVAKKTEADKGLIRDQLGSTLGNFKDFSDIEKLEQFAAKHPDNYWIPFLDYVITQKRLLRFSQQVKYSEIEVVEGATSAQKLGWFAQAAENEGVTSHYDNASDAADEINSGGGSPITIVTGKKYNFIGYVENTSSDITYSLDVRCDFQFKTTTTAGVWWFRKTTTKTFVKSAHYFVKDLEPGRQAPFICSMGTHSGSAINLGLIGGSTGTGIEQWQVRMSEMNKDMKVTEKMLEQQKEALAKAGLGGMEMPTDDFKPAAYSPDLNLNAQDVDLSEIDF